MDFDWQFLTSTRVVALVLDGLKVTLWVSAWSALGALMLGGATAVARVSGSKALRLLADGYVLLLRNVPLLVVLFFFYFGLPVLVPPGQAGFLYAGRYEEHVAILAISIAAGAYISEVIRSGIESVSAGQLEAALATGLTRRQGLFRIVLPQIPPVIIPGLTNELIIVVKDSSLALVIGVGDLTSQAQQVEAESFKGFEATSAVTVIYLLLSFTIFVCMSLLNAALKRRTPGATP